MVEDKRKLPFFSLLCACASRCKEKPNQIVKAMNNIKKYVHCVMCISKYTKYTFIQH